MLNFSLYEDFIGNVRSVKDHIVRNKDHYLLGGGLAAGIGGAYYLKNQKLNQNPQEQVSDSNQPSTGIHGNAAALAAQLPNTSPVED